MNEPADKRAAPASRPLLLALVTVTGASLLALEVLSARVVGTYYGSSLYVWAAVLSVTLSCLAVGYAVGGRLADRVPHAWMLCLLVLLGGASVLLTGPLRVVLAPLGQRLGLAWGALASIGVIFFLPLTLLAMAGPYVIRLLTRRVEGVGSASGTVYAVSTLGSVGGALAAGFWMIPTLGTRTSMLVLAGVLMALGAVGLAVLSRGRGAPLLLLAVAPALAGPPEAAAQGELFHTESAYGDLRVIERTQPNRGAHRMLMVNGIMQTGMPLDIDLVSAGAILQSDSYYLELLPYFHLDLADGRRGVLIGLAGGMFPRVMEFYTIDWTAVEIDVKVAQLARDYFGYRGAVRRPDGTPYGPEPPPPAEDEAYAGRAIIQDGRQYLLAHPEPADFIVVDAYNSDTIPFHLITREFFEIVRDRLTDDGILAINYIGRPEGDSVTNSLFRTLAEVFGSDMLSAYRTRDDASEVQVIIIFAFRRPMKLYPFWRQGGPGGGVDRLSYELARRRVETDRPGGAVITDDLNPIDLARAETALAWRRQTAALFE